MVFGHVFVLAFIASLVLITLMYRYKNAHISRCLIIMTMLVSFWILMEAICFYIKSENLGVFFQRAKYVGVILFPPLFYMAANAFVKRKKEIKPLGKLALLLIPVLSIISVVSGSLPYSFSSDNRMDYLKGIPIYTYSKEVGFWINTIYSYIIVAAACTILMVYAIRAPRLYKKQSIFVFVGSTAAFLINILFISEFFGAIPIDSTSLFILLTLYIFYWGIFRMPESQIIPAARELVIETTKDIVIILDNSDCIIDANPAAVEFIRRCGNYKGNLSLKHKLVGVKFSDALEYIPDRKSLGPASVRNKETALSYKLEGRTFYFTLYEAPIRDLKKQQIGKMYLLHDITELQEHLNNLQYINEELAISDRIINDTLEGILITDPSGRITKVNSAFERISGYSKEELIGNKPNLLKSNRHDRTFYEEMWRDLKTIGYWNGEIWDRKKNGEVYPKWMSISSTYYPNGELANYISVSSDLSKIKKAENDLQYLAYNDPLTGLANRALFYERLNRALIRAKNNGSSAAILFMDLDRFKVINDTMGHAAGDIILVEVAKRMREKIRETDTIARLGGDEFTVILEDVNSTEEVKTAAQGIIDEISKPFVIMGREVTIGVSIGIAMAPVDEGTAEGLMRKADAAMYHAKDLGRGQYSFSSEEIENRNKEILDMEIRLRKALANKEFQLYLQPQMAFNGYSYEIVGAEALIRWKTAEGQIYTPDKFIPIAEENGMIRKIGDWVLEEILRLDKILRQNGINIRLSINVSVKQFENGSFINKLRNMMGEADNSDIDLTIEITESMFMQDIEGAIGYLKSIKELGIGLALDDFGTGYSSLKYLSRLPVDYLKIDKSFVASMGNKDQRNLTSTIISMAKSLDLKTVAEGVETREQMEKLLREGCEELQGYYFSRPVEFEEFMKFVKEKSFELQII